MRKPIPTPVESLVFLYIARFLAEYEESPSSLLIDAYYQRHRGWAAVIIYSLIRKKLLIRTGRRFLMLTEHGREVLTEIDQTTEMRHTFL